MASPKSFRRECWKLERLLFRKSPPEIQNLDKVFTGRGVELARCADAIRATSTRILIHGVFGVGKTIFIHKLLRGLSAEHGQEILTVNEKLGKSVSDLPMVILRGLAKKLSGEDELALKINATILGMRGPYTQDQGLTGQQSFGYPDASRPGAQPQRTAGIEPSAMPFRDPAYLIQTLIQGARKRKPNRSLVVAVDDLDKTDPAPIRRSLLEARSVLLENCCFIMTGHPLGILRDAYSTLNAIFDRQEELPLFGRSELKAMIVNYLAAGRVPGAHVDPLVPFTSDAADAVVARSLGIPRVLNCICDYILTEASESELPVVGMPELVQCWEAVGSKLLKGIQPDLRRLLEVLFDYPEGISPTSVPDEVYQRLGVDSHEELLASVHLGERSDWIVSLEDRLIMHPTLLSFTEAGELDDTSSENDNAPSQD